MIVDIPKDSCPRCKCRAFFITEYQIDTYQTDSYGQICNHQENSHFALGRCEQCGKEYRMFIGQHKFIPLSGIREFLIEYEIARPESVQTMGCNPMQKKDSVKNEDAIN